MPDPILFSIAFIPLKASAFLQEIEWISHT